MVVVIDEEYLAAAVDLLQTDNAEVMAEGLLMLSSEDHPEIGWPTAERCLLLIDSVAPFVPKESLESAASLILNSPYVRRGVAEASTVSAVSASRQSASFCSILGRWFTVLPVAGDGNCAFRAAVRAVFAPLRVPRDHEDAMSFFLREQSNSLRGADGGSDYSSFVLPGINDSETMSRPGEWADALQLLRMADLAATPVHVLRYDDPGIVFDTARRTVIPSDENRIGASHSGDPLLLLFTPSPGHYEALCYKVSREPTLEEEVVMMEGCISEGTLASLPLHACSALFLLEAEVAMVQELLGDADVRRASEAGLKENAKSLERMVARIKGALAKCRWQDIADQCPGRKLVLHMNTVSEMVHDAIAFVGDEECTAIEVGAGPLSALHVRLCALLGTPETRQPTRATVISASARTAAPTMPPSTSSVVASTVESVWDERRMARDADGFALSGKRQATGTDVQNDLITQASTAAEHWRNGLHCGNVVQFRHAAVCEAALRSLWEHIKQQKAGDKDRILYLEFFGCRFDEGACEVIRSMSAPLNSVRLEECLFVCMEVPSSRDGGDSKSMRLIIAKPKHQSPYGE